MIETQTKQKIVEKSFNYNPGFLREEISCTLGPVLYKLGELIRIPQRTLVKISPHISRSMKESELIKKLPHGITVEDIKLLDPWYHSPGFLRRVERLKSGDYVICSAHEW